MKKGQAFSTFKLLIAGAFAVALLIIVYAVISLIHPISSGVEDTQNLLLEARSGVGRCFSVGIAFLDGEEFSANAFKSQSTDIVNFHTKISSVIYCIGSRCEVKQYSTLSVSVKCEDDPTDCDIYFGSSTCS